MSEWDEEYEDCGCLPDLCEDEEDGLFCEMSGAPFLPDDDDDTDGTLD